MTDRSETLTSVWVCVCVAPAIDSDIEVVAVSADAAKRAVERDCGVDGEPAQILWKRRNSMFDFQDYWVGSYDGCEYHVSEIDLER